MPKMTVAELLDATGVSSITKTAAAAPAAVTDFSKLAQLCREAATEPAVDPGLAEKTAEVAVIAQTLQEIAAIANTTKTASAVPPGPKTAEFIKRALAEGHDPTEIAEFLKTGGWLSRKVNELRGGAGAALARPLGGAAAGIAERSGRAYHAALRDVARTGNAQQGEALVAKLRRLHGDEAAAHLVEGSGARLHHLREVKDLMPKMAPEKKMLSAHIGGKDVGLTADQLKAGAKPAALAAGAAYVGHKIGAPDEEKKGKKGVVVINS